MITLFACPKPFSNPHIATIQANAIRSWTLLKPRPDILVFGDEDGIAETCAELKVHHVRNVERNEYGTPLLHDVVMQATQLAKGRLLCYINSDIILTSDFGRAIQQVEALRTPFLMSGGRSGIDISCSIVFGAKEWEDELLASVHARGQFSIWGNDYFVFTRGLYHTVPPLAIGRAWFDAWLFDAAKKSGATIIDASATITAIHQNHDYQHTATGDDSSVWSGPEADRNNAFVVGRRQWFLMNATHKLTSDGPQRVWGRKMRFQTREFLIYNMGGLRKVLHLDRAHLRRLADICGLGAERDD